MRAAILSIGDELALGQSLDTNATWLAARLAEHGVVASLHLTVEDDEDRILRALQIAAGEAPIVVTTGGLGPTRDDLTRFALTRLLGTDLVLDEGALERIRAFFERRGRRLPEANRIQAMGPRTARLLENPVGTAPAIHAVWGDRQLFSLPGVPSEMRRLFELHVLPRLDELAGGSGRVLLTATLHTFGEGESQIAERLGSLTDRNRRPSVGTTVAGGVVSVRVRSEGGCREEAEVQMRSTLRAIEQRLGSLVFGRDETRLQDEVGRLLRVSGRTLVTAESCTGGLLGKMVTDPAGASRYYLGGWVVYSDAAKVRELGVPTRLLERHGAVSRPVAEALAEGARIRADADLALAVTGVAGPTGGSERKPVGTVWLGLAERGRAATARRDILVGGRPAIRARAARMALNLLRRRLLGLEEPDPAGPEVTRRLDSGDEPIHG